MNNLLVLYCGFRVLDCTGQDEEGNQASSIPNILKDDKLFNI